MASKPPKPRWYHNLWITLFILFFVLGPLGLPLVWNNPRFSKRVKYALTLAMILYTIVLIRLIAGVVAIVTEAVNQFNSSLTF